MFEFYYKNYLKWCLCSFVFQLIKKMIKFFDVAQTITNHPQIQTSYNKMHPYKVSYWTFRNIHSFEPKTNTRKKRKVRKIRRKGGCYFNKNRKWSRSKWMEWKWKGSSNPKFVCVSILIRRKTCVNIFLLKWDFLECREQEMSFYTVMNMSQMQWQPFLTDAWHDVSNWQRLELIWERMKMNWKNDDVFSMWCGSNDDHRLYQNAKLNRT